MNRKISGLYAIVDETYEKVMPLVDQARLMVESGAKIIQLRMKQAPESKMTEVAQSIVALKKDHQFTFIINDYPEIAVLVGADGVHVGQTDMPVSQVRKIVGPFRLIGKSNHTLDEAKKSLLEFTDYVAVGAIFPTVAKGPDHPVVGCSLLKDVSDMSTKAIVAIGGINSANLAHIKATGAQSFAVVSGLVKDGLISQNVKKLIAQWENLP